jgi:hypothetical protein
LTSLTNHEIQLKAELSTLQRAHEIALLRAGSPLTDLEEEDDDDEIAGLKSKLKQKEAEITRICRELEETKAQTQLNGPRATNSARFPTPETTLCVIPTSHRRSITDMYFWLR